MSVLTKEDFPITRICSQILNIDDAFENGAWLIFNEDNRLVGIYDDKQDGERALYFCDVLHDMNNVLNNMLVDEYPYYDKIVKEINIFLGESL